MNSPLQGFTFQFAEQQAVWDAAVSAMGELDALMSLALAANQAAAGGPICRPLILSDMDIHQQVSVNTISLYNLFIIMGQNGILQSRHPYDSPIVIFGA